MNSTVLQLDLPGVKKLKSGKVREIFDLGDRLLLVATDRISAFDCIMPNGIPRKGEVLTQISYFWFGQTESFQPNHLISRAGDPLPPNLEFAKAQLTGRSMIVKKAKPLAIECVVRGYLAGSGWKGIPAESDGVRNQAAAGFAGILASCRSPFSRPATKAETGHDENISFAEGGADRGGGPGGGGAGRLVEDLPFCAGLRAAAGDYHCGHEVRVWAVGREVDSD
jgi:phosphoribosylaminoimidazole-succinocarboxamide synthase